MITIIISLQLLDLFPEEAEGQNQSFFVVGYF